MIVKFVSKENIDCKCKKNSSGGIFLPFKSILSLFNQI